MLSIVRVGEASNPGPSVQFEPGSFTIGTFNPSGLRNKSQYFCTHLSDGDIWAISETHFFGKDVSKFRTSLRASRAQHRYVVTDETSLKPCLFSQNAWKGVATISKLPTRAIPSAMPTEVTDAGRALLTATLVDNVWITGATVYGEPDGHLYPNHVRNNECLLHHVCAQICHLSIGCRYIAGDFNVDQDSLPAFSILHQAGFRDVQDLALERWGAPIQLTCKMATRKDFLYISPELQALLLEVNVQHDVWPDHSVLWGSFRSPVASPERWVWPQPSQVPWPKNLPFASCWNRDVSPTRAYQQLWKDIEQCACVASPFPLPPRMLGRAQRLEPALVKPHQHCPVKVGRQGDFQPTFCGPSRKHAQWIRQVRRLQTYCRLLNSPRDVSCQSAESWGAILRAKGFFPDFPTWWEHCQFRTSQAPEHCPVAPPSATIAMALFDSVSMATRHFEAQLSKQSRRYAKLRRESNANLVFSDVKSPVAPGVDILLQPIRATVEEVVPDEGKIVLDQSCAFQAEGKIICDGRALDLIHHEADALWVSDVSQVSPGAQISQSRFVGTPDELAKQFLAAWRERWQRHADVPADRWQTIIQFAVNHLPRGQADWTPMTVADLARVIKAKKARTSSGFDGVTLQDLRCMPESVLQAFCDLFSTAESTGHWPNQLVDGRVISLAKVSSPSSPSDFRPITVFSLLYRCWSSFHARKALQHLDPILPDTLFGSRQGCYAAQVWAQLLWTIEESFVQGIPTTGAVADLTKAFNFLPRLVIMELAAHMGIPGYVLLAWTGALTQMRRRFVLRDTITSGIHSTTGVPEGCGLSCVAMVVIDACFHKWMQVHFPLCTPVSFVDDWQILTCHPSLLQGAVDCMHRFADAMDLHLDARKSYAWSLCSDGRKHLKQQGFRVVLGAKNLGAHVQLSRKHTNATLQDRIDDMTALWPRLRLSAASHRVKVRALVTAAWPRALHAVAATTVSDAAFHKLRTGAVKGLSAEGAGVNAWVHCGMVESPGIDPQCWAVLQTFRSIRECGHQQQVRGTLAWLVSGADCLPANSFTSTLLVRIQLLGWHVLQCGQLHDSFGAFCLFSVSFTELMFRVHWAWNFLVAQKVSHRPGFSSLHYADPGDTRQWLWSLSRDDQELFKKCLNGAHITQDAKVHCQEEGTDLCPYCNSVDSRFHRFWQCERFAAEREHLTPTQLDQIACAPEFLTCYGWSVRSYTSHTWFTMLHSIPVPDPVCFACDEPDLHFFTDGSCLNQQDPGLRVASWAVIRAPLALDGAGELIDSGPLPGLLQSSFRAELFAIRRALELGRQTESRVFLWTDCQAVVGKFRKLLRGCQPRPNSAHSDLWTSIWDTLQDFGAGRVLITKVAAHQDLPAAASPLEEWCAFHNHFADSAAGQAQWKRPSDFWQYYARHVRAFEATKDFSRIVQHVILRISQAVVRDPDEVDDSSRPDLCESPAVPSDAWRPPPLLHIPQGAVRWYGDEVVRLLLSWYWQNVADSPYPVVWISHFQLYIDFMKSGSVGPIKLDQWRAGSSCPETDLLQISFQKRTRWFIKVLKESLRHHGAGCVAKYCRPVSRAFNLHTGCLAVPWCPARLEAVDEWVLTICPAGVRRTSKAVDSLPCAEYDKRFDVVWISSC